MVKDQVIRDDQFRQAATFAERGAAIPFTTPMLAGARARRAARGFEFTVPNPTGARGIYILTRNEITNYCAATVHDQVLGDYLSRLASFSPRSVRAAARMVAKEGAAGRAARDAARAAESHERQRVLKANALLLKRLVLQTGGGDVAPADLGQSGKRALEKLSATLGRSAEVIMTDIAMLGALYADLGLDDDPDAGMARGRRIAAELGRFRIDLAAWADRAGGPAGEAAAAVLAAVAVTLKAAHSLMAQAQTRAADTPALLRAWAEDPDAVAQELERTDWLLDGWERIALLWRLAAADGGHRAALAEIAYVLPQLPAEAAGWAGGLPALGGRGAAALSEDWRAQSQVIELIARNELIRSMAA